MTEVTICFCCHQNFVPNGLSAPAPGLYTFIKSLKNDYKVRLQRDFLKLVANDGSDVYVDIKSLSPVGLPLTHG